MNLISNETRTDPFTVSNSCFLFFKMSLVTSTPTNSAGATGHVARRTMLGDDGNLMQADGNSFPVFILGWTIGRSARVSRIGGTPQGVRVG